MSDTLFIFKEFMVQMRQDQHTLIIFYQYEARCFSSLLLLKSIYQASTMCKHNGRYWRCEKDLDPVSDGEGGERENHHDKNKQVNWGAQEGRFCVSSFPSNPQDPARAWHLVSTQKIVAIASEKTHANTHTHMHLNKICFNIRTFGNVCFFT